MRARAALLALVLLPSAVGALELERLNRTYTDVAGEMAPLVYDPLVIRLSSPAQTVIVRRNSVRLTPVGGGRYRAAVEVELSGKGTLIADIDFGGAQPQRMTDEVVVPPQTIALEAVVSFARGEGGYRVVAHELPAAIRVDIRSRVVGDILETCSGLALLSLGALDCAPVTDALERPRIPMPAAGAELWLPDADLTEEDRREIDALLR